MSSTTTTRDPRILTVDEVADELRLSAWSVRRLIRLGHIKAVKISGVNKIETAELEAYIERNRAA